MRLKWLREPLIGPLAAWELVRLARRGQAHRTRLMVLYLLLLAFVLVAIRSFNDSGMLFSTEPRWVGDKETTQFGNHFALAILEATAFAIVLMTPAFATIALAEDKERQALDLLLTTPLSDYEIVFGKAAGRLGFVLAAAAAVVPVLTATTFFGGVSGLFIVCGSLIVAATALPMTGIGVYSAATQRDLRTALVWAYAIVGLCLITGGPFVILAGLESLAGSAGEEPAILFLTALYVATCFILSALLLFVAARCVRHGTWSPAPNAILDVPANESRPPDVPDLPPVDENDPIRWKERNVLARQTGAVEGLATASTVNGARMALGTIAVLFILIGGVRKTMMVVEEQEEIQAYRKQYPTAVFSKGRGKSDKMGSGMMVSAATLALAVYVVPAALALSAIVARERRRATLHSLLALPIDRAVILRTKARVILERGWQWVPVAALTIGIAFWIEHGPRLAFAATALALGGAIMIAGLGTWLSVRCQTEVRALRLLMPAVVVAFGGPIALWNLAARTRTELPASAVATAATLFAILGVAAWWRAGREFERLE